MKKIIVDFSNVYMHITPSYNLWSITQTGLLSIKELKTRNISYKSSSDIFPSTYGFLLNRFSGDYASYSDDYVRFGSIHTPTFKTWFTSGKDITLANCHNVVCFMFDESICEASGNPYQVIQSEASVKGNISSECVKKLPLLLFNQNIDTITTTDLAALQNYSNRTSTNLLVIDYNSFRELFNPAKNNNLVKCIEFIPEVTHDKNV